MLIARKALKIVLLFLSFQFLGESLCAKDSENVTRYHEALSAYRSKDYSKVKELLEPISSNRIPETIVDDGQTMYVGPAILDLLGWTYADEKKYDKALGIFKRMEKVYPKEVFRGRLDGEGYYAGPGGAVGLRNQLWIYAAPQWIFQDSTLKADCASVIKVSRKLIESYPNTVATCWEGCGTFSKLAIDFSGECLSKVSAKEFDASIGGLLKLVATEEKELIARTRMQIADRYLGDRDYSSAISNYREVAQKYLNVYYVNGEDGVNEFYGIDALKAILHIQQDQKATLSDILKTKEEIRVACENLNKTISEDSYAEVKDVFDTRCSPSPEASTYSKD